MEPAHLDAKFLHTFSPGNHEQQPFSFYERIWKKLKPARAILCYHSLAPREEIKGAFGSESGVPINRFEEQIQWLANFAQFVSLDEILQWHRNKKDKTWMIAITFDDGYRSVLELGLPIFEKYKIPITWFITTAQCQDNTQIPWWDQLRIAVSSLRQIVTLEIAGHIAKYDLRVKKERKRFLMELREVFLSAPLPQYKCLQEKLQDQLSKYVELPSHNGFVSPEEIWDASRVPWIKFGAHTISHVNLLNCSQKDLEREIKGSRLLLQEWSSQNIEWFAFPYGTKNCWSYNLVKYVQKYGFKGAVTTIFKVVRKHADIYALPRLTISPSRELSYFKAAILAPAMYKCVRGLRRLASGVV